MKKSEIIAKLQAEIEVSGDTEVSAAQLIAMCPLQKEEQERRGQMLADVLSLRKDTEHKDRYQTSWGTKTPIGLFGSIERIILVGE